MLSPFFRLHERIERQSRRRLNRSHRAEHRLGFPHRHEKADEILLTLAEYAAELANYTNQPALAVDFVEDGTAGGHGQRSASGYSIGVTSVDVADDSVTAHVKLTKPARTVFCWAW